MPLGIKSECATCKTTECLMWNSTPEGKLCTECFNTYKNKPPVEIKEEDGQPPDQASQKSDSNGPKLATRKSTRSTRNYKTRLNPYALPRPAAPKGKGRRIIFKKSSTKAPSAVATPVTSNYLFYKGTYIQVGDIVSMRDVEGDLYYAQIRGLLIDQYCEKSAAVTWLIPTQESPEPEDGFDASTYIIGPEEDIPRKLDCMEFICHAPSDYFKSKTTPYPPINPETSESRFIWTRIAQK